MSSIETLLIQCQKGDSKAQKAVFNLFSKKMFLHCYRYLRNKEDAEDILVQAFVKVFKNLGKFEYKGEKAFEAWLRKIMINEALLFFRKKNKIIFSYSLEAEEIEVESSDFSNLYAEDIYKMIAALPTGLRTIFNLYAIEGYDHKEIAELLNIKESTSRSQLMKARRALQDQLTKNNNSYEI
jgi:RNA polymerase sigma factor (sigma-70 family)